MLLNCGVGEDSVESLGLQGDQTSQSWRKSTQTIQWKDWCWSWSSSTLATWCKEMTLEMTLILGKIKGRRRSGWQRMRWLDGITDSMHMSMSELQDMVEDREAWCASVHGVTKSWTWRNDWTAVQHSLCVEGKASTGQKEERVPIMSKQWGSLQAHKGSQRAARLSGGHSPTQQINQPTGCSQIQWMCQLCRWEFWSIGVGLLLQMAQQQNNSHKSRGSQLGCL